MAPVTSQPSVEVTHDPVGLIQLWRAVHFASTPEDFTIAWVKILEEFPDQEEVINYLQSTSLSLREQWAECYTRFYQNFGIRVTSRTEGNHKEIKSYLRNASADLLFLVDRIQQLVDNIKHDFVAREAKETQRMIVDYRKHQWLGDMRSRTNWKAQELMISQHNRLTEAIRQDLGNPPLPACTHSFTTQFGLPCIHRIQQAILTNEPLNYMMSHKHWHLGRNLVFPSLLDLTWVLTNYYF